LLVDRNVNPTKNEVIREKQIDLSKTVFYAAAGTTYDTMTLNAISTRYLKNVDDSSYVFDDVYNTPNGQINWWYRVYQFGSICES
jgi:hypothetical protein